MIEQHVETVSWKLVSSGILEVQERVTFTEAGTTLYSVNKGKTVLPQSPVPAEVPADAAVVANALWTPEFVAAFAAKVLAEDDDIPTPVDPEPAE